MTPTKIITTDELARIVGCPRQRINSWLDNQPDGLVVEKDGKKGLDPVTLALFLKQQD